MCFNQSAYLLKHGTLLQVEIWVTTSCNSKLNASANNPIYGMESVAISGRKFVKILTAVLNSDVV